MLRVVGQGGVAATPLGVFPPHWLLLTSVVFRAAVLFCYATSEVDPVVVGRDVSREASDSSKFGGDPYAPAGGFGVARPCLIVGQIQGHSPCRVAVWVGLSVPFFWGAS